MANEIAAKFADYVFPQDFPRIGDAHKFVFRLPFVIEGSDRAGEIEWPWSYSDTQEAIDQKAGVDGLRIRFEQEMDAFRRHVEKELAESGQRLYAVAGTPLLVRGPKPDRTRT